MRRLTIVVPYRARERHLGAFVPSLRTYFARDKSDRDIPYRVLIVEQDNELPFNRGALKNIGFMLGREDSDYTCFHDVDYLPLWADYSWPDRPTAILWHGAETAPIAPGRSTRTIRHNPENLFGGVVLVPNEVFARVNGYANSYWGWGYEDDDFKKRFASAGIAVARRKGTFQPLHHDNEGFSPDGPRTLIGLANEEIFYSRWMAGSDANTCIQEDGLRSVSYEIVSRVPVAEEPIIERPASWEKVTVRLCMKPTPKQIDATERDRTFRASIETVTA